MGRSIALGRFPKGNEGKTQGGLPLGNPVCLWQTELFKLNLKSSPSSSGYNRRRRLAPGRSGKQQAGRTAVRTAPIVCPEESPLLFCRNIYTPLGFSPTTARRFPKGERKALWCARRRIPPLPPAGPDAPTPARGAGLAALWALNCIGWRSEGVQGASGKPPACIDRRQLCRKKFPLAGPDAPTPARGQGLQPYGALTLFFRWRKKSVQKKASGTATPEAARPALGRGLRPAVAPSGLSSSSVRFAHPPGKRLLLPILTAGLAMSRAAELASLRLLSCALGARLFPPSKWAGLFPSAAYRRSAPPQLAVGILTPLRGFCFRHSGCGAVLPLAGEKVFCGLAALPLKRKKASAPVQLALGRLTPCRDSASVTVGVVQSCPLRGNGILMLGRFWKVIGQRVWGCEP